MSVRPARPSDAGVLASLAGELGYPTDPEALPGRLAALHPTEAAVMVATDASDTPIGWCHVELRRSLVAPLGALVGGLVIAEAHRSLGIGAELLHAVERWARERNCACLAVATRVTRERAHRFYLREGYEIAKTSHLFEKRLD